MSLILRKLSSNILVLLLAVALLALSGCGKQTVAPVEGGYSKLQTSTVKSSGTQKGTTAPRGSTPYTVMGKTYYPILKADNYSEHGIASWYGKDFHGKKTANGERYDMYGMTAAHKLLPFGTMVRVTNKNNGKSIVVRINDRGPFVDNRIIDLSHSGAKQLDMLAAGTAPVYVETIGQVKGLHDGKLEGNFYIQVGAFGVEANAGNLAQTLRARGFTARTTYAGDIGFWRVQVGPYSSLGKAESVSEDLKREFKHNFIVAD